MFWFLMLLFLLGALLLECTLQAEFHWHGDAVLRLRLSLGGVHKSWRYQVKQTGQGHQLLRTNRHGTKAVDPLQFRQSRGSVYADILRRSDKARHFLLTHIHLDRLEGHILLRTEDAAASALLSAVLQDVLTCAASRHRRSIQIRVLPDFFRAHSTVRLRCIIRFRLGTIILTAGMLLGAYLHQQHLTESEAMAYGTSHR